MKRFYIKSLFAALLLLCSTVASAQDFYVDGIYYNITDATAKTVQVVSGGDNYKYSGNVVIPDKVTYNGTYSVTRIGNNAFNGCTGLTSITIPNSVTAIGYHALENCSGLTSIKIPGSVTSIEEGAFGGCKGLASITISNSVTSIGSWAFSDCSGLTRVTIGNSVKSIGLRAFNGCSSLKTVINLSSLTFSKGSTDYGYVAYYANDVINATNGSVEGDYTFGVFNGVNTLYEYLGDGGNITLPESYYGDNYVIAADVFKNNTAITSVTIPNSVTGIGDSAFRGCSGLKTVINLSSLTFSKGSTDYGYVAYYAENVINGPFEGDFVFDIIDGVNTLCAYVGDGGDVTLPENYNGESYVIAADAFKDNTAITSVTIGNSVTSIGSGAFDGCTGLTSVTIGNSVTSIGSGAFDGCTGLTAVHISDLAAWCKIDFGVYSRNPLFYAHNLYLNGEKVTDLVIPSGITDIKQYAFEGCTGLSSVTIPNSVTSIGSGAFSWCRGLTSVTIPNSVTSIDSYAFKDCSGLTSVTIPNSVTSIGQSAFEYCSGLTSVTIGNSVTSIGVWAFEYCTGLKTVINFSLLTFSKGSTDYGYVAYYAEKVTNVPYGSIEGDFVFGIIDGVNTLCGYVGAGGDVTLPENYNGESYVIAADAFKDNTAITSITIPNSVTSIGDNAFYGCSGLTAVHISDLAAWCRIDFSNYYSNPLSHAHNLYLNGEKVTDLVIPYGVTEINSYAFDGCSGLTSVTIPNSVTSIGRYAFDGCSGFTSVTIPNSVTSIGDNAFDDCTGLKTVINFSLLTFSKGSTDYGYVAYYAEKVTNAPYGFIEGDFVFCIIDGVNALCGYGGAGGDVTLPENYNGESYVIAADAFKDNTAITSVTIPDGVTSIGNTAFYACTGLTSIEIPGSVTGIGSGAFNGCSGLTSVTIGDNVTSIGDNAFTGCDIAKTIWLTNTPPSGYLNAEGKINYVANNQYSSFSNVVVYPYLSSLFEVDGIKYVPVSPAERTCDAIDCIYDTAMETVNIAKTVSYKNIVMNVKEVKPYTCFGNSNIKTLNISNGGSIDESAFNNCINLTSVTIGNSVTSIGSSAFEGCGGLTSVTIGNSVTSIGNSAFSGCSGLTSIEIPGSVTSIGYCAFSGCSGLTSVTIPNSVTSIEGYAFDGCSGLTSIEIPGSVTSIGGGAFNGCSGLTAVHISDLAAWCKINFSVGTSNPLSYAHNLYLDGEKVTDLVIPSGITDIKQHAFNGCSGLTSVTIGDNVTSIGSWAFNYCTGLTSVTIPNSVTSIGERAFNYCSGLTSVTIPNSVTSIEGYAFYGCSGLTSVTIPNSVTRIEWYAFYGCSGLTSVTIGNSVTGIGSSAFENCSSLTSIEIPGSVTSIGGSAFENCSGLTSVTIGDGVTNIGENAFENCSGFASVIIPNSVTSIEGYAFRGCSSLKTVINLSSLTFSKGSTDYGYVAYYADKVTNATNGSIEGDFVFGIIDGVNTLCRYIGAGGDVTLPENYNGENYVIGADVFKNNTAITSVTIGNSVTGIGSSAFENCSGLTSIEIPGSVTSIEEGAFGGCRGLASITIGNSVTSIGDNAFYGCSGLKTVINLSLLTFSKGSTDYGYVAHYADKVINEPNCSAKGDFVFYSKKDSIFRYTTAHGLPGTVVGSNHIWESPVINRSTNGVRITVFATNVSDSYNEYPIVALGELEFYDGNGNKIAYSASNVTTNSLERTEGSLAGLCDGDYSTFYHSTWRSGTVPDDYVYLDIKFPQKVDAFKIKMVGRNAQRCVPTEIGVTITGGTSNKYYTTAHGLPGTVVDSNHIWESPVINSSTNGVRITVFATNVSDSYNEYPIVALGELEFYDGNGKKINYTGADVTTNSLEGTEGSLYDLCDGDYSTYYHSTWRSGTIPDDYVYLDIKFPQTVDAFNIKMVGRNTQRCVPTEIGVTITGGTRNTLVAYTGNDTAIALPENFNGENYVVAARVFEGYSALSEIKIPQAVASIGDYAFKGCSSLANVIIENREVALSLGSNGSSPLFADCPLDSVYIGGKINYNTSSSYGYSPFYRNASLRSVVITDVEEQVYDNEFYGCSGLKNVQIGNGVKSIGKWAFSGCSSLDYLIVGANVSSIGQEAFSDCTNVTTIYSYATVPPVCGTQALEDINKWNCTLLVPKESITKYQSAEQWKDFFFISEISAESLPGDVNEDGRVSVADITTVVDAILNESSDTAYDVNGDSRVSVADITTIVDIILNEGASAASNAPARVATRSTSALSLYIDPFEINAGEEKEILVNLSNAGTEITAVEFDLFLPEGLEVVSDEYGYYISPGSRTPNKRNPHAVSGALLSSGAIHVICYHNSQLAFTGEDGDVLAITIKAADDLEPGNYTIDLRNIEIVNPADPKNGILISDSNTVVTDIENIEAEEGTTVIYDLNGRKVAEPVKGGIYIINGKKVVVNK